MESIIYIILDSNYYLFYSNEYISGKILVDFKISNIKGPCLDLKKNNEICSFYLEKCNLKEKDYVCDLHKTDNGFTIIDSEKFDDFVQDNKIISIDICYTNSIIYLYSETYIGYIDRNGKNQGGNIHGIKNFSQGKNIFLFLCIFIYITGGILLYIFKKKKDEVYMGEVSEYEIESLKKGENDKIDEEIKND